MAITVKETETDRQRQSDRERDRRTNAQRQTESVREEVCLFVGWLLNVPATG